MRSTLVLLIGGTLLVLLGLAAQRVVAPAVEGRVASIVGQELREAGLPEAVVSIDGRDAWVDVEDHQPELHAEVLQALESVPELRAVHRRVAADAVPARLLAEWAGSTIRLEGSLRGAGTDEARARLSDGLRRTLGNATIVNELALDPDVERALWVRELPRLLRVVWSDVKDGSLRIEGLSLSVTGSAVDENVRSEVGERLSALAPGLRVRNRITVPGGHAEVRAGIARILAKGSIEFHEGSGRLTDASRALLDEIADLLQAYPEVSVRIEGYLSSTNKGLEIPLSRMQAVAVRDHLLENGALASRLTAYGLGSPEGAGVSLDQEVSSLILFLVEEGD